MNNPINPIDREPAIVAQDRWRQVDRGCDIVVLRKIYKFLSPEQRVRFVADVLYYELQSQHNAEIVIEKVSEAMTFEVTIEVFTRGIDVITELDKSYAAACDQFYRDIVYNVNA
jgi:pterin-4a-carbinolamine dehydratase